MIFIQCLVICMVMVTMGSTRNMDMERTVVGKGERYNRQIKEGRNFGGNVQGEDLEGKANSTGLLCYFQMLALLATNVKYINLGLTDQIIITHFCRIQLCMPKWRHIRFWS